jgi:hypothetical protein
MTAFTGRSKRQRWRGESFPHDPEDPWQFLLYRLHDAVWTVTCWRTCECDWWGQSNTVEEADVLGLRHLAEFHDPSEPWSTAPSRELLEVVDPDGWSAYRPGHRVLEASHGLTVRTDTIEGVIIEVRTRSEEEKRRYPVPRMGSHGVVVKGSSGKPVFVPFSEIFYVEGRRTSLVPPDDAA